MKTQTESMQPTSLESRFTRSVYNAYVRSPKQPPLVFQARAPGSGPLEGVDVVRCRRNGLANAWSVLHTINAASHVTAECLAPALDGLRAWLQGDDGGTRPTRTGLPPKYIKQVKTDCVVLQGMPRKFRDNLERLVHNTYPDGKPKFRHEKTTKPLQGKHAPPCMQCRPAAHCLAGRSLLLTGLPGTGKTHLARIIDQAAGAR